MKVDIRELGQFNHLASQGAQRAARSLSQLTGVGMDVEVTDVSLVTENVLAETFTGQSFVGVELGLEGGLEGETVLAFERERALKLQDLLLEATGSSDELAQSSVTELGNIMIGGFIDGWANHLGEAINMTPPKYTEAVGSRILPDQAIEAAKNHGVFLFESKLEAMDVDLDFSIYMLPEYRQFVELLSGNEGNQIPVNRLSAFEDLAKEGAGNAAGQIGMMTGLDTDVDISRLRFVPLEGVPRQVGDDKFVGVVFELKGMPSGYLVVLFDEQSAKTVASSMMPGGSSDEEGIGTMTEGAIKELGNIMTSGFIDGWANVLGTSIEHTPPNFVHDMGSSIMSPVVGKLGKQQEYAFVIDSTIEIDGRQGRCDIYALPNERELARALSALPDQT